MSDTVLSRLVSSRPTYLTAAGILGNGFSVPKKPLSLYANIDAAQLTWRKRLPKAASCYFDSLKVLYNGTIPLGRSHVSGNKFAG